MVAHSTCNTMRAKLNPWVSSRKMWLQWVSNGVTSFLHQPIEMQIRLCTQNRNSISWLHSWTMQCLSWLFLEKIDLYITRKHHARLENVKSYMWWYIIIFLLEFHNSISVLYCESSWVWLPHLYSWRTGKSALNSLNTKLSCQPSRLKSVIYTHNIIQ